MFLETPYLDVQGDLDIDDAPFALEHRSFAQLPEDLRSHIDEEDLIRLVESSVERVAHYVGSDNHTPAWQELLRVLTYYYSIGVYASDEIAVAVTDKVAERYPAVFQTGDPESVLRRFRRHNRVALENCLCAVLNSACSFQSDADVEIESTRRVMNAIQADSCALDF